MLSETLSVESVDQSVNKSVYCFFFVWSISSTVDKQNYMNTSKCGACALLIVPVVTALSHSQGYCSSSSIYWSFTGECKNLWLEFKDKMMHLKSLWWPGALLVLGLWLCSRIKSVSVRNGFRFPVGECTTKPLRVAVINKLRPIMKTGQAYQNYTNRVADHVQFQKGIQSFMV